MPVYQLPAFLPTRTDDGLDIFVRIEEVLRSTQLTAEFFAAVTDLEPQSKRELIQLVADRARVGQLNDARLPALIHAIQAIPDRPPHRD